jgi:hypothetical protein
MLFKFFAVNIFHVGEKMKRKVPAVITILMLVSLSACGPAPEPTRSADEIAATALADAFTQVALTQAALPSATALPTDTPLPSSTPAPTSTSFPTLAPSTATPQADPCQGVPPLEPKGDTAQLRFVNKSKGQVNLSFGMNPANSLGECGIYSISMGIYDSPTVTVLAGCYWGYAWVEGNEPSTARTNGAICLSAGQSLSVSIGTEVIGVD